VTSLFYTEWTFYMTHLASRHYLLYTEAFYLRPIHREKTRRLSWRNYDKRTNTVFCRL